MPGTLRPGGWAGLIEKSVSVIDPNGACFAPAHDNHPRRETSERSRGPYDAELGSMSCRAVPQQSWCLQSTTPPQLRSKPCPAAKAFTLFRDLRNVPAILHARAICHGSGGVSVPSGL